MNCELTSVFIKDLKLFAYHGVLPQERVVGAYFILNIAIDTDFREVMATDELDGTISYAEVLDVVKAEMAKPSRLLEHVAGRIGQALLDAFPSAQTVHLEILKQNPPMGADCGGAGVRVVVKR
ncbi:MAG: dihydroneopterin aldolase [Bacteroidales bacterium]|nr:dihydroneopterin aldolase [Bacteroidales bacterium]